MRVAGRDAEDVVCRGSGHSALAVIISPPANHATVFTNGQIVRSAGGDVAEPFTISGSKAMAPGAVLVIDNKNSGGLCVSDATAFLDTRSLGLLADRQGRAVAARSRFDRLQRNSLGLVEAVLPDQHLGESALALAECAAILERLQQADRLA